MKFSSKSKAIGLGKITIFDNSFFHKNSYRNKVVASKGHLECFFCAKKGLSANLFLFLILVKFLSKSKAIGFGKITIFYESFFHINTYLNKVVASKGNLDCFLHQERTFCHFFLVFILVKSSSKRKATGLEKSRFLMNLFL